MDVIAELLKQVAERERAELEEQIAQRQHAEQLLSEAIFYGLPVVLLRQLDDAGIPWRMALGAIPRG